MRQRYQVKKNVSDFTSGFPTLTDYPLLDVLYNVGDGTALTKIVDETIDLSTVSADSVDSSLKVLDLDFVLGKEHDGKVGADPVIEVRDAPSGGGNAFTIIADGASFGASTEREARVWNGTGRIDFNVSQLSYHGITNVYVTYYAACHWRSASREAAILADIRAIASQVAADRQFTATAGENLSDVFVYVSSADNKVYTADPSTESKRAVGYVAGSVTSGNAATVITSGEITPDVSVSIGVEYFVGRNGKPVSFADTGTNGLQDGDYQLFAGFSVDGTKLRIDLRRPIIGRVYRG